MYFCFLFRTGMSPPLAHPGGRGLGDLRIATKSESKPPPWTRGGGGGGIVPPC